jgi:hypothetical protein
MPVGELQCNAASALTIDSINGLVQLFAAS